MKYTGKYTGLMAAGAAALLLAGCGDTKLMARTLPDETRVIDGPSLAVPPDYELRPPREASDYESVLGQQKVAEAHALITGVSATSVVSGSGVISASVPAGDAWLVEQTQQQGGIVADPNVRAELEKQTQVDEPVKKPGLWQRWFGKNAEEE